MKKLLIIFTFIISTLSYSYGQCVQCGEQTASGTNASIIGPNNTAPGAGSVAMGANSHTPGLSAIAIGSMLQATNPYSFVIGTGGVPSKMLINNYAESLMIGFNSTKPTLFISTSPSNLQYDLTGKVGIGNITDPQAKLHIKADEGEDAEVFIQSHNWSSGSNSKLLLGNTEHGVSATIENGLTFHSETNYLFEDGNVAMGVEHPLAKLHINGDLLFDQQINGIIMKSEDGSCWKGTISNNGELVFNPINCDSISTIQPNTSKERVPIFIYPNPAQDILTIEYFGEESELVVEVRNISGSLLLTQKIYQGKNSLQINQITDGLVITSVFTLKGALVYSDKIITIAQ